MPNDAALVELIPLFISDPVLQRKLMLDNSGGLYGF